MRRYIIKRVVPIFLPWRKIRDFNCLACGVCCYNFKVPIKPHEAVMIVRNFGRRYITSSWGKQYITKEDGEPCPFLLRKGDLSLCTLQSLGMKPTACKVWPFYIFKRPAYGKEEEAYFSHKFGSFYVYVDQRCPGLIMGKPSLRLREKISEAIEIWLGTRKEQDLTCSSRAALSTGVIQSLHWAGNSILTV